MTDVISPSFHAELVEQLDSFAASPYGFLRLGGTHFRLGIGFSEIILALVTLAPYRSLREWAYNMLGMLMNGAIFAHYTAKDGKEMPAQIMLMFIVYLRFYDFSANFFAALAQEFKAGQEAMASEFAAGQAEAREKKAS